MYTIKEVAKKMDISEHTLRFWAKSGFFPFIKRNKNNIRLMNKFLVLALGLFIFFMSSNIAKASKDSEIRSYRAMQQTQSKVINKGLKAQKKELTNTLLDTTLTEEERTAKAEEIRQNMANLYSKKEQNKKYYKRMKKNIKMGK